MKDDLNRMQFLNLV